MILNGADLKQTPTSHTHNSRKCLLYWVSGSIPGNLTRNWEDLETDWTTFQAVKKKVTAVKKKNTNMATNHRVIDI